MNPVKLVAKTQLNTDELKALDALVNKNLQQQGDCDKIYWNVITKRSGTETHDYLFYDEDHLIGYLAIYEFSYQSTEFSLILDPEYQKTGPLNEIRQKLLEIIASYHTVFLDFILTLRSNLLSEWVMAHSPKKISSHVEMRLNTLNSPQNLPSVRIIRANYQDILTLAKIGTECFQSEYIQNLARFTENLKENNRIIWLVYHKGKIVGKIHARIDLGYKVFIHDLGILPEFRGKKLATSMIIKTIEYLKREGFEYFYLDVDYLNEHALKLYQNCGFKKVSIYEIWRVERHAIENSIFS